MLSTFNNPVLDKYALYALPYRIIKELDPASNNVKLYEKMQREDIDYIIYKSGRKVGAEELHETYNEDGSFNDTAYSNVINVPFNAISLQQEVPSKDDGRVTRASQITKLATLDLFDSGVPVDYTGSLEEWLNLDKQKRLKASPIYNLANQNKELLDELTIDGMNTVMKRLGIVEKDGKLVVEDLTAATQTLREEIFKRETNDNVSVALDGFLNGDVVIEGTPAYNQVRNILYSIVQKNVVRPKISGRQAVQIPSALFEQGVKLVEINGKKGYVSDVLDFYKDEDGKRVMEVMVGRWFNSSLSDKDLLDYLNNTEEGQKAPFLAQGEYADRLRREARIAEMQQKFPGVSEDALKQELLKQDPNIDLSLFPVSDFKQAVDDQIKTEYFADNFRQEKAGGGIMKMAGKSSGPAPESGPTPAGS